MLTRLQVDLSQTSIQLHIVDDVSEAEPISLFQLSLTKIDAFVAAWSTKVLEHKLLASITNSVTAQSALRCKLAGQLLQLFAARLGALH